MLALICNVLNLAMVLWFGGFIGPGESMTSSSTIRKNIYRSFLMSKSVDQCFSKYSVGIPADPQDLRPQDPSS